MSEFRTLDLFSGVGAYSLGLERTGGFRTVAFVEIEEFPRRILRKHWPDVPIFEDVKHVTGAGLRASGIVPDWIVAGWPCQGNSPAGTGLGMDDPRSGLWSEIVRLAGEIRPRGLLLENSSNLLNINDGADFGRVLGDLATLGYDAEWHCLSAAAFDAPHIRDRVWIIATLADAARDRRPEQSTTAGAERQRTRKGGEPVVHADPDRQGLAVRSSDTRGLGGTGEVSQGRSAERMGSVSDAPRIGRKPRRPKPAGEPRRPVTDGDDPVAYAHSIAPIGTAIARQECISRKPLAEFRGVVHGDAEGLVKGEIDETAQAGPSEILRSLRGGDGSPRDGDAAGGSDRLPEAEILRQEVHGGRPNESATDPIGAAEARFASEGEMLLGVRDGSASRHPPQGPQLAEQRSIEFADALLFLSHEPASSGREHPHEDRETALSRLWRAILQVQPVQHASHESEAIWQSLSPADQEWCLGAADLGHWHREWPGVERVTGPIPRRVERIHALGNLNPPIIPESIGRAILRTLEAA